MKPILIVEDEATMRDSLRDWLIDSGYQVETTEEGEEALKTIAEQDFGVVILDLKLPGKDGIEVLREAKEKNPQLRGVIITAYPSVQTAVEAMKEGAIDYLPKSFDLNELEKLIRKTLGTVQVEIKPKAITEEATAKRAAVERTGVEEVVTIGPEEAPLASFLKEVMRRRKCLPSQLAADLGVSHATVSRWLSGADLPSTRSCRRLAEYSGESLEKILSIANHLPRIAETGPPEWPEFAEYARRKYPIDLDEDLITVIENLIERRRDKRYDAGKGS